jgi:hypothetical protein
MWSVMAAVAGVRAYAVAAAADKAENCEAAPRMRTPAGKQPGAAEHDDAGKPERADASFARGQYRFVGDHIGSGQHHQHQRAADVAFRNERLAQRKPCPGDDLDRAPGKARRRQPGEQGEGGKRQRVHLHTPFTMTVAEFRHV